MAADSRAIDKVALPCPTICRPSWLWESFLYSLLPDPETVSDVAWMALAWHMGVLEHYPGMLKKILMQRCLQRISFLFYHECTNRVNSYSQPWETMSRNLPKKILIRFTLPQFSSNIAHDLLHSHLSARKECFYFIISYVLAMALATAFSNWVAFR